LGRRLLPVRAVASVAVQQEVAAYLNAAAKDSQDAFTLALRDVAEAYKISSVAVAADVNRETLECTRAARGEPTFTTLGSILEAAGLKLHYRARAKRKRAALASG
jgi:DNA-binding phage protein